jgi:hypothetical protein
MIEHKLTWAEHYVINSCLSKSQHPHHNSSGACMDDKKFVRMFFKCQTRILVTKLGFIG